MDKITSFLMTLARLYKPPRNGFLLTCLKCTSTNVQVALWPDVWAHQEDKTKFEKGLLGLKCLSCGYACDVDYGVEMLYG